MTFLGALPSANFLKSSLQANGLAVEVGGHRGGIYQADLGVIARQSIEKRKRTVRRAAVHHDDVQVGLETPGKISCAGTGETGTDYSKIAFAQAFFISPILPIPFWVFLLHSTHQNSSVGSGSTAFCQLLRQVRQ